MGLLLMMRWCRTTACVVFHSPLQKELVCIIPPSFTVMLYNRRAAHLPGHLHTFLLPRCKGVGRRISQGKHHSRVTAAMPRSKFFRTTESACEDSVVRVEIQPVRCKRASRPLTQRVRPILCARGPIPVAAAVGVATTTAGADPTGCSRICHL